MKSHHEKPIAQTLCGACIRRQGLTRKQIGNLIAKASKSSECSICGGLLSTLGSLSENVAQALSNYEFETFLVGTSVPQSMLDREDEIRSALRIRGRESLKAQITRTICKKVSALTRKKVDYSRPDITVLVPLGNGPIVVTPRSIWLSAKYRKLERGISQKNKVCCVCNGLGCASCDFEGKTSTSVQSIASEYLTHLFEAEKCNFIWVGGEDENSLVLGSGRQFYVEVLGPKKRKVDLLELSKRRVRRDYSDVVNASHGIEFKSIKFLSSRPTQIPMFKLDCEVHLIKKSLEEKNGSFHEPLDIEQLEGKFRGVRVSVKVSRKFKRVFRFVDSVKAIPSEDGKLNLRIRCDGGIPIRKLVRSDDDSVAPNLSSHLKGYAINDEHPFDILDVSIVEPNGSRPPQQRVRSRKGRFSRKQEGSQRSEDSSIEESHPSDELEQSEAIISDE